MFAFLKSVWKFVFNCIRSIIGGQPKEKRLGSERTIKIECDELGVAKLTLNRPKKKNAITEKMYGEIQSALTRLSEDPKVKVCLIIGSGDFYCAGNDLSNFSKLMHPLTMAKKGRIILEGFVKSFILFKKPIVVAVNGPAIGIAVTSLGLCDRVYASDTAYFKTPFAALGQAPEGCSSYTFPKLMGEETAHQVLWEGKVLDVNEALACGLIHSVHTKDTVEAEALKYCHQLVTSMTAAKSTDISYRSKLRQESGAMERLLEVNRNECDVLQNKWVSKECFDALIRFLESRKMTIPALLLRIINMTGFLWGQPK